MFVARTRGWPHKGAYFSLRGWGTVINAAALIWGGLMLINFSLWQAQSLLGDFGSDTLRGLTNPRINDFLTFGTTADGKPAVLTGLQAIPVFEAIVLVVRSSARSTTSPPARAARPTRSRRTSPPARSSSADLRATPSSPTARRAIAAPSHSEAPVTLEEDLIAALQVVPEIAGRQVTLTALSGGITNRNFLVELAGERDRYVIRLAGNDTHLLGISREVEHAATVAAAGVGVGPEVTAFIRNGGYLVTRFIEGSSVSDEAVHRPETIRRVANSIRRIHDGPAIPGLFIPLRIVEAYRALALARGVSIPPEYAVAQAVGRRIELAFLADPVELRPCHNDLLNGNFIDDGSRIRIVDWEYAGMGDPFFDLGNFSANHGLTADEDGVLLAAYDQAPVRPARLARITLMRVVSDFREAMWGVLQQGISTLDVDFVAYAGKHFDRLLAAAATPAFERALRDASGG